VRKTLLDYGLIIYQLTYDMTVRHSFAFVKTTFAIFHFN